MRTRQLPFALLLSPTLLAGCERTLDPDDPFGHGAVASAELFDAEGLQLTSTSPAIEMEPSDTLYLEARFFDRDGRRVELSTDHHVWELVALPDSVFQVDTVPGDYFARRVISRAIPADSGTATIGYGHWEQNDTVRVRNTKEKTFGPFRITVGPGAVPAYTRPGSTR